jgi:hypothetical protein
MEPTRMEVDPATRAVIIQIRTPGVNTEIAKVELITRIGCTYQKENCSWNGQVNADFLSNLLAFFGF